MTGITWPQSCQAASRSRVGYPDFSGDFRVGDEVEDGKEELTPKQYAALQALLTSLSIDKAADKAGVDERTIRKWLKEDYEFKAAYRSARREVVEHAIGLLQKAAVGAVGVLVRLLKSGDDRLAFQAACAVLDRATSGVELLDLAARVEDNEALVQERLAEIEGRVKRFRR